MSDERQATALARVEAKEARMVARGKDMVFGARGVMLANMADLRDFAEVAVRDGVAPKGMTVGQAMMAIQAGLERGMAPLGGLQAAVVVNGVLSWRGWAAIGFIQQSGLCLPGTFKNYLEGHIEKGDARGVCIAHRSGYPQPFFRTFSIADAKRARLWTKSGPWTERPGNMLEWRAVGDMARFHFPEALGGIPIAEDVVAGGVGEVAPHHQEAEPRALPSRGPGPALVDPLLGSLGDPAPEEAGELIETEAVAAPEGPQEAQRAEPAPEPSPGPGKGAEGKCPRCGAEEYEAGGLFAKCPVCNYPEEEPGR